MNNWFDLPSSYRIQKTLRASATFTGHGLHTGQPARMTVHPCDVNHGIQFTRTLQKKRHLVMAHYDSVVSTEMATTLGVADLPGTHFRTVEHLMASLFSIGITNVLIELDGPEIPILDGSASPFIDEFLAVGIELQSHTQPTLRVTKPIKVYQNGAVCELLPRDRLRLTTSVDFPHPRIGLQTFAIEMTPAAFKEEIGRARTFGFLKDVEKLKQNNLALGASLENVLAFSESDILNPEGSRFEDECVRHKLLDAVGDLALSGCWLEAELVSFRGGHSIHFATLKALRDFPSHWEILPAEAIASGRRIPSTTEASYVFA